jgi:hypothetical protein
MSQVLAYTIELFGPRKGQTVNINGHQFINGVCRENVPTEAASSLLQVLSYYGAYADGTAEFKAAKERELAENTDGADEVHESPVSGEPDEVPSDTGSDGDGPAEEPAVLRVEPDAVEAETSGSDSSGDGHEDAGVIKFEELADIPEPVEPDSVGDPDIKAAMWKLDPDNSDHWAKRGRDAGKPKLSAVENALGKAGLTRADLEAALPGWNRDVARIERDNASGVN